MTTRERLHQLVDMLSNDDVDAFIRLIANRDRTNPLIDALLAAPGDDEIETPEELSAIAEAYADITVGRVVDHAEAVRLISARA